MKVIVDATCDILYSSYYIKGLQEVYGKNAVTFSSVYFENFELNNKFLAFVIIDDKKEFKVIIDFGDAASIDEKAYEWSTIYGKINVTKQDVINYSKLTVIGPSFGIKIYNPFQTVFYAFSNYLKAKRRIPNKKRFLSNYYAQYKRAELEYYFSLKKEKTNYVYFLSSLWKKEEKTNLYRKNFILACKNESIIQFEGGFSPRTNNDISGFEKETVASRVSIKEYLSNIKNAEIVFNTPAVLDCHGWKLGEYFALGKIVLSTPLSREMPSNFDANLLFYCNGSESDITEKIESILNTENREKLEKKVKHYFDENLSPISVIKRIIDTLQ